ncbi:MAG: aminotransferase class I/II-fold pyridoxal phosphate-dependent enzyme [Microbacterium sp.]
MHAHDDPWRSIPGRSAEAIASGIRDLVERRALAPGTRLPTIRWLALTLSVSPTTVTDAWSRLLAAGIIRTEGRRGTFVSPRLGKRNVSTPGGPILMDIAQGAADPSFQPRLQEAFQAALAGPDVNAHDFAYITPELLAAVTDAWPYRAEAWTTADGGMDASALVLRALTTRERPVAVEQPTAQRTMALLRNARRAVVGVTWDREGPDPDELRHAVVTRHAAVFYWQPRAHYPTGRTVSAARLRELAAVLAAHPDVLVVEDDMIGDASSTPARSLGRLLPERVVRIGSFDLAYGLDLRTAVISGSVDSIREIQLARGMFAVWNSRVLQNALAWLLADPSTQASVRRAARRYASRRRALSQTLTDAGVHHEAGDGLVLWIPVRDEIAAVDLLETERVPGGLGSVCWLNASDRRHVRIPVGGSELAKPERGRIARAVARAADA